MFRNSSQKRCFISIYFINGITEDRQKRDVTISFNVNDPLYKKCRNLGSSKIKEIIDVDSYKDLVKKARKEGRSINNFIKFRLKKNFEED